MSIHTPDFNSSTWLWLKDQLAEDIQKNIEAALAPGLDPVKTEYHRGIIRAYKNILAKSQPTVNRKG